MSGNRSSQTIARIFISKLNIAARNKVVTPIGVIEGANNVIIQIETVDGLVGWGEASPFAPITGNTQEASFAAAKMLGALLKGKDALAVKARMAEINKFLAGDSSIRAAFDMALYDLAAQAAGMPLYQFMGGEARPLKTGVTIGHQDAPEITAAKAQEAVAMGFDSIKLKVGRPGLSDVAHVAAVRGTIGDAIPITIDSNQGWDLPTALATIRAMSPYNLLYAEQPLPHWDLEGHAHLRMKTDVPICIDESVFTHRDALRYIRAGAADIINIKLGKTGGLEVAQKAAALAEAAGIACMIGCFAESRLGLTAAAHLAASHPIINYLDLDSALLFSDDPVLGGMTYDIASGGRIVLPDTPGLGAQIDDVALECTEII